MTQPRFFAAPEDISEKAVTLRGTSVTHIRTVLRMKSGDRLWVLDGRGGCYGVRLTQVGRKTVTGEIVSRRALETESPLSLHLGQVLLKGNKLDHVLRQGVELGVCSVTPLRSERCVVKVAATEEEKKIRRWRKIALEAGRQSGRSVLPEVAASLESVGAFCRRQEGCDLKLIFWEEETTQRLQDVRPAAEPRSIACLIGPEGGFTRAEVETARERGFQSLSLGPRILKAETAPVAMLALLQHLWGDM